MFSYPSHIYDVTSQVYTVCQTIGLCIDHNFSSTSYKEIVVLVFGSKVAVFRDCTWDGMFSPIPFNLSPY